MKSKKKPQERPSIGAFHDPVGFLKAYCDYRKKTEGQFSLRSFSTEMGIATGYLPMLFSGQRPLTIKAYRKIRMHLQLNKEELNYLDLLVELVTSEKHEKRVLTLEKLQRSQVYSEMSVRELEVYRYLVRWENVAIREMARLPEFRADAEWIKARLRSDISLAEIEEALQFLVSHGFLVRASDGQTLRADKSLECHSGVFKISLGSFHEQVFDLAKRSIHEDTREERLILGHTTVLSEAQFQELQEKMQEWLGQVESLNESGGAVDGNIYHLEMALFPLTTKKGLK